jgi:hypothetical protein
MSLSNDLNFIAATVTSTAKKLDHSVKEKLNDAQAQQILENTSKAGLKVNEEIGGIISLNASSDMIKNVEGSIPTQSIGQLPITKLTSNMKGLKATLEPVASTVLKETSKNLTNDTLAVETNLNEVISLGSIEAISSSLKSIVPDIKANEINSIIKEAVVDVSKPIVDLKAAGNNFDEFLEDLDEINEILEKNLNNVIATVAGTSGVKPGLAGLLNSVSSDVIKFKNEALSIFNIGFNSMVENAIEKSFAPATNILNEFATKNGIPIKIKDKDKAAIFTNIQNGNILAAVNILQKYSDRPLDDLVTGVRKIDNRMSTFQYKKSEAAVSVTPVSRDLSKIEVDWRNGYPVNNGYDYYLDYMVSSEEELITEISTIKRAFTEVIIDCTGTPSDVANDMYSIHYHEAQDYIKSNGFPWHYYILKTGIIERVRPVNIESINVGGTKNHDKRSIIIMIDGGTTTPYYEDYDYNKHAVRDKGINQAQYATLEKMIRNIYYYYPGTQVFGYHEINKEAFPYLNVPNYIQSKFNKKNIFNPFERDSLTLDELRRGGV